MTPLCSQHRCSLHAVSLLHDLIDSRRDIKERLIFDNSILDHHSILSQHFRTSSTTATIKIHFLQRQLSIPPNILKPTKMHFTTSFASLVALAASFRSASSLGINCRGSSLCISRPGTTKTRHQSYRSCETQSGPRTRTTRPSTTVATISSASVSISQ